MGLVARMKRFDAPSVTAGVVLAALSCATLQATEAHAAERVEIELAALASGLKPALRIVGDCVDGHALFQVTNTGTDLPNPVEIQLLRIGEAQPISKRAMRMKSGQTASFRLAIKKVGPGEFGVRVVPSWAARDEAPDIRIACQ